MCFNHFVKEIKFTIKKNKIEGLWEWWETNEHKAYVLKDQARSKAHVRLFFFYSGVAKDNLN